MQVELNKIQLALATAHAQLDDRLRRDKDLVDKQHARKCARIARERANAKARLYEALGDSLGVKLPATTAIWPTPDGKFMIELPDPPKTETPKVDPPAAEPPVLKVLEKAETPKNGALEPAAT